MTIVMAIIFGCLGVVSWGLFIAVQPTYIPSFLFIFIIGIVITVPGLIAACISIFRHSRGRGIFHLYAAGILVNAISVLMMIFSIIYIVLPHVRISQRGVNIGEIQIALLLYMQDHSGQLPVGSSWCDALVTNGLVTEKDLVIISKDGSRRNYAMNAHVLKNTETSNDMVLIFESVCGWNLIGDENLLVGDDYKGGGWILFKDLNIRYVYPEEFESLRWTQ